MYAIIKTAFKTLKRLPRYNGRVRQENVTFRKLIDHVPCYQSLDMLHVVVSI